MEVESSDKWEVGAHGSLEAKRRRREQLERSEEDVADVFADTDDFAPPAEDLALVLRRIRDASLAGVKLFFDAENACPPFFCPRNSSDWEKHWCAMSARPRAPSPQESEPAPHTATAAQPQCHQRRVQEPLEATGGGGSDRRCDDARFHRGRAL